MQEIIPKNYVNRYWIVALQESINQSQLPFKMIGTFKQEEELLFASTHIRLKTFVVRQSLQRIH